MTELDSSVGDDESSPSFPSLVDALSSQGSQSGDSSSSSSPSSSTSTFSRHGAVVDVAWEQEEQQQQWQQLCETLQRTTDQNHELQRQLTHQTHLYKALVTNYQMLQEQLAHQVQLNAQQQECIERLLEKDEKNHHQQVGKTTITAGATAKDIVEKSFALSTSWSWWLGMGAVVVTVVGGGVVMHQLYAATAAAAEETATNFVLAAKAAWKAEQSAKLSTQAADRSAEHVTRAEYAARVSSQAARRAAHHRAHWMEYGTRMAHSRNYADVPHVAPVETAAAAPRHHRHHHHCHYHRHQRHMIQNDGNNESSITTTNHSSSTGAGQEPGHACSATASDGAPYQGRWMTPEILSSGLKIGAVAAVPLLLAMIGC